MSAFYGEEASVAGRRWSIHPLGAYLVYVERMSLGPPYVVMSALALAVS
jgi:hypothetical protein